MFEYVSAKHLLDKLATVNYMHYGNIELPWEKYITECDLAVTENPTHWDHNVKTKDDSEVWNADYQLILDNMEIYRLAGYRETNTRVWKTTMTQPKITFPWEADIVAQLPINNAVATPTLQQPGNIMPMHVDNFVYLKKKAGEDANILRFLIFMKDWQDGHVLQVGDSWLSHWNQGDVYVWHPTVRHVAINAGFTDKWTCNVTGVLH